MYFFVIFTTLFLFFSPQLAAQENGTNNIVSDELSSESEIDIERGGQIFFRCNSCHSITANENENNIAPNLYGIFGRKAGSLEGYENYSKALKEADFIWDEEKLDNWLKNPNGFLPGNTMAFSGILRQKDRDNIIAYIKEASEN